MDNTNFGFNVNFSPELVNLLSDHVAQKVFAKMEVFFSSQKEEIYRTSKEVCQRYGITAPTLNKYCKSGLIKKHYLGGKVRFVESELSLAFKTFKKYHIPQTTN